MVLQGGALENSTAERSVTQFLCGAQKNNPGMENKTGST
jgi:hypothetical protein